MTVDASVPSIAVSAPSKRALARVDSQTPRNQDSMRNSDKEEVESYLVLCMRWRMSRRSQSTKPIPNRRGITVAASVPSIAISAPSARALARVVSRRDTAITGEHPACVCV